MSPYIFMTRMDIDRSTNKRNKFSLILGDYIKNKIIGILALIFILGGFYVYQINQLAVLGYDIKKSEKDNAKILKEVAQLRMDVEKMKTANNLQAKTQELNMVESKKISYIYVSDGVVINDNLSTGLSDISYNKEWIGMDTQSSGVLYTKLVGSTSRSFTRIPGYSFGY